MNDASQVIRYVNAAHFIGAWLADTPETEVFCALARQVHDEARHYKIVMSQLEALGESLDGWEPEPEWVAWIQEFYPAGDDTLERVAAHNITGELGAAQGMEDLLTRVPPSVQIGVQGLMIIVAVALSIDRKLMRIVK